MSSDPFNPSDPAPRDPAGYDPYAPDVPPPPDTKAARDRVQLSAIFLIIVGVLNLLLSLAQVYQAVNVALKTAEQAFKEQEQQAEAFEKIVPGMKKAMMEGQTPEGLRQRNIITNGIVGGVQFLAAVLSILGGARMLKLRSYGLCVIGAIAAAIPLISTCACCGLGEIVGIWALVVLLNSDVRAAFR
jgi:hypothetical protein